MKKRKKSKVTINRWTLRLVLLAATSVLMVLTNADCASTTGNTIIKMDLESETFYQEAHFLFTRHEKKIFNSLVSPEDRKRFIQYFWDIRNPNPYTDENEFKLMMDERFTFVNSYLKEGNVPGWKTDRGRIYMLLGPPDFIESQTALNNPNVHGYILWAYGDQIFLDNESRTNGLYILFVDRDGHGRYYISIEGIAANVNGGFLEGTDLRLLDEAEEMKYKHIKKKEDLFEKNNLAFHLNYDENKQSFHIAIQPKNVIFDENADTGMMTAKFKIDMVIYEGNENFFKHTEVKTIAVKKEELLLPQKDQTPSASPLRLDIPMTLKKGQVTVDVFISDLLGDAGHRNLFSFYIQKSK